MPDDSSGRTAHATQRSVMEIPLLSDSECKRRGIAVPAPSLFDRLSPEERLKRLSPLIDLIVESVLEELANQGAARSP